MKLLQTAEGTVLEVLVKPNSRNFALRIEGDELIVLCREAPVKGRVNKELVKELSRVLKRRVDIVSGFASRQKRLLIRNASEQEVFEALSKYSLGSS